MPRQPQDPEQQQRELITQIATLGHCLPGSITTRQMRCGRIRCACKADSPKLHGPYTYWTRKEHGRTIARLLDPEQTERYQPQIDNARRLRQLVAALEALAIKTAEDAETWGANSNTDVRNVRCGSLGAVFERFTERARQVVVFAPEWRCPTGACRPASTWVKADRLHPLIPRETARSRKLYRSRGAVEREFGRLKHEWALLPLRVRGLERVRLHAQRTILAKLSCVLARARTVPLTT